MAGKRFILKTRLPVLNQIVKPQLHCLPIYKLSGAMETLPGSYTCLQLSNILRFLRSQGFLQSYQNSNQQILKRIKSPNQISRAPKPQTNNTELIYGYIREGNFNQAIEILEVLLDHGKRDRGVLSILAFCYFSIFDFQSASTCYQELTQLCPEVLDYTHHFAQCYYKLGKNDEALVVCNKLENTYLMPKVQELKAAICYDKNDFQSAMQSLHSVLTPDYQTLVNEGCVFFKLEQHEKAISKFKDAIKVKGYNSELYYNIALAYYEMGIYSEAYYYLDTIIRRGYELYPQLKLVTVDNPVFEKSDKALAQTILRETAIVEALNLKASILYNQERTPLGPNELISEQPIINQRFYIGYFLLYYLASANNSPSVIVKLIIFGALILYYSACAYNQGDRVGSKEVAKSVPVIHMDSGPDPVTFHNLAVFSAPENPEDALQKLASLLTNQMFPPETLQNILFISCKNNYFSLACDILRTHQHLCQCLLTVDDMEFVNTLAQEQARLLDPKEAIIKYQILSESYREKVMSLQHMPGSLEKNMILNSIEKYISVVTALARLKWSEERDYRGIEILMLDALDFIHAILGNMSLPVDQKEPMLQRLIRILKTNQAHSLFMQEDRHFDSITIYEDVIAEYLQMPGLGLLTCEPIVLANLCVEYIITKQNQKAEKLIQQIESQQREAHDPSVLHLCIVNLVIGTLYCSKGNLEFGVRLVLRALDPVNETLGTDTWLYAKRCMLGLVEKVISQPQILPFSPELLTELLSFLETVQQVGRTITSAVDGEGAAVEDDITLGSLDNTKGSIENESVGSKEGTKRQRRDKTNVMQTVSHEALLLKKVFLKINAKRLQP